MLFLSTGSLICNRCDVISISDAMISLILRIVIFIIKPGSPLYISGPSGILMAGQNQATTGALFITHVAFVQR